MSNKKVSLKPGYLLRDEKTKKRVRSTSGLSNQDIELVEP